MLRLSVLMIVFAVSAGEVFALGEESFGNTPLSDANFHDWPHVMSVVNDPHRVYHSWVNGNENFYFQGDAAALNAALRKFALIEADKRTVILRPAPGMVSSFRRDRKFEYQWQLHLLSGIAKHMSTRDQGHHVWDPHPEFIVYVGGSILPEQIELPENVDVLQLADLKARYSNGLKSTHTDVRGWTCGSLAALDPYDAASMEKIAGMLEDKEDWVKLNAAGALKLFVSQTPQVVSRLRAVETKDPKLQERLETTIQELQQAEPSAADQERHAALIAEIERVVAAYRSAK